VSFLKKHLPGIGVTAILSLLPILIVYGYSDDLNRHLDVPDLSTYHPTVPDIVRAYHDLRDNPSIIPPLLDVLLPRHSPVKRAAYAILLSLAPEEKLLAAYLYHTRFTQNAGKLFNVSHRALNPGEILLLCDQAFGHPIPQHDPDAALARRINLLVQLHKNGALTDRQYHAERKRALSLSADHRPVY